MYELEINGELYPVNFGIGFVREINKTVKTKIKGWDGVTQDVGFRYHLANMLEGSYDSLEEIIMYGNAGKSPRIKREVLDAYIDDENTDNDALFDKILGFLQSAAATKKMAIALGGVRDEQIQEKMNEE